MADPALANRGSGKQPGPIIWISTVLPQRVSMLGRLARPFVPGEVDEEFGARVANARAAGVGRVCHGAVKQVRLFCVAFATPGPNCFG